MWTLNIQTVIKAKSSKSIQWFQIVFKEICFSWLHVHFLIYDNDFLQSISGQILV